MTSGSRTRRRGACAGSLTAPGPKGTGDIAPPDVAFPIVVGDDVESARREQALADTWLRITCRKYDPSLVEASVSLNGSRLDSGTASSCPSSTTVTFRDIPVVQGENRIEIALDRIEGQDCLRIVGIELVIAYV